MVISTPEIEVTVLPEIGGKIARIRHRSSAADLLIPPGKPYQTLSAAAPWVDFDTSGMDDCFPNVDEGPYPSGPWRGTHLPQLGEWVRGQWQVGQSAEGQITLEKHGFLLPYRARKTVEFADERTLRLTYEVRNTGTEGFHYLWSAHPLIAAGENFTLRPPGGDMALRTFPNRGCAARWPVFRGIDLSHEWVPYGRTLKVFISGLDEGWCELTTAGRRFRFEFDVDRTPVLGLWFNNNGFSGGGGKPFRCIAVEPCTAPTDVLHDLPLPAYPFLAAGSETDWWFTLRID